MTARCGQRSYWYSNVAVATGVGLALGVLLAGWRLNKRRLLAAIDIGSGEHKLVVAEILNKKQIKVIHSESISVALALDLQKRENSVNELSSQVLEESLHALRKFSKDAKALGVIDAPAGIATAVFRRASNGEKHIARAVAELKLRLAVVDQELEARLGFLTATAAINRRDDFSKDSNKKLLSWDSGGGSFQISDAHHNVYLGPIGNGDVYAMLRDMPSANTATLKTLVNAIQAKLPPRPQWLTNALENENTLLVGFGHTTSIFRLAADCIGKVDLNTSDVEHALYTVLLDKNESERASFLRRNAQRYAPIISPFDNRPDTPYPETNLLLPKLALLLAVMTHLDISCFHYEYANGSCLGIFLHDAFWPIRYHYSRADDRATLR